MREYQLFIDGEFADAADGKTFETRNPSDGSTIATVARAGREDIDRAVAAARKAADAGTWANMPPRERTKILLKMADLLQDQQSELSELEAMDAGHTVRMANLFTVPMAIFHWREMVEMGERIDYTEQVASNIFPAPSWGFVEREPYGVCAGIIPWNFPLLMCVWKAAPAMATGNCMILKPSPYTPITALELARVAQEAGLPKGVLQVVPGTGPIAGEALVTDERVDKIAFTGSTGVGRRIMQLASATIKKVTLELGGKSANILLDDADLDIAVPGALWATFLHQGQICHSGTRCFVPASLYDEVVARMVELAEGMKVGSAMDFESDMGPVIDRRQLDTIQRYIQAGQDEGAKLLTGGGVPDGVPEGGYYVEPTIFGEVDNSMKIAQEEIFGPVLSVIRYESVEDAVRMANDTIYGLAGAVWSRDIPRATSVARRLKTGTVWINDYHLISAQAPFGGYKQSGLGRELGRWGLDEFLQSKYIQVDQTPSKAQKFWYQVIGL
ncbi:MAG TPA: aldehyde dehydrogenase [Actinobacteria bacterium]|jgi:aldehyde dehydrogenase (NAD+)|nr:aldehyde dehydrogenase [Actinomycetota bacterium]HCP60963.1 aldehyde dehydrogenase [Actinomycetota bacterium]